MMSAPTPLQLTIAVACVVAQAAWIFRRRSFSWVDRAFFALAMAWAMYNAIQFLFDL